MSLRTLTARIHPVRVSTTFSPRAFSTSHVSRKWEGRKAKDNTVRETDSHNVQFDAVKEGKEDRARGDGKGSRGASGESGGSAEKTKEEFPEAPDTIGMQDERGGKEGKK